MRPDLPGEPHHALAADDGVLQLRLVEVGRGVMVPDLHLGSLDGGSGQYQGANGEPGGEGPAEGENVSHIGGPE